MIKVSKLAHAYTTSSGYVEAPQGARAIASRMHAWHSMACSSWVLVSKIFHHVHFRFATSLTLAGRARQATE